MSKGYYLNKKGFYVIDKQYLGQRLFGTTRYRDGQKSEVEALIREKMDVIYQAQQRGQRPPVTFRDCAVEYVIANSDQKQIENFKGFLARLDPYVGPIVAAELYRDHPAIVRLVDDLRRKGRKNKTINAYLEAISRVLRAATEWRYDWCSLTWLETAPRFKKLPNDSTPPRAISWEEQDLIFPCMAEHLRGEAVIYVNTGLRDTELNNLRWENELLFPGGIQGFIVDAKGSAKQKYKQRLIVLNDAAAAEVNRRRGDHPDIVFVYKGKPKLRTHNTAFKTARRKSGIHFTVHGLRHTFGHRLRMAGVDKQTRAELLGHGKSLTEHYSAASIQHLYESVQKIMVKTTHQVVVNLEDYRRSPDKLPKDVESGSLG